MTYETGAQFVEEEEPSEGDISKDEVTICIKTIASVPPLKSGVTHKGTFRGFDQELVLSKRKNTNKIDTNQRQEEEKREVDEEN